MEPKGTYYTAAEIAAIDAANREVALAGAAIRAERNQVNGMATWLLQVIHDMNCPPVNIAVWRAAVQQVYERLGEAVDDA